ncbi:hypothetical protein PP175_03820 [Aneurinibacillus sp. Ricciae_BoGa-3]|uniref:amidoligase family protein n=1 Tax=Aneurinibacillus sp. Ricciae_BoGa-3 TaxID=3022697 RepID=UPI0023418F2A|nr:amidoligase family protein [Aneurinibacillus sp. Ricciae_BoGa-3]WCK55125.1 hypothetical protein PP175_03820 [Aneurinibacillus sp. Ricciae_BoGa-3]
MNRKEMVKILGEHFGVKPTYLGVPSCNYQIETAEETYIIDRAGNITTFEGKQVEFEQLLNGTIEENKPEAEEITGFEISVSLEGHTGSTLRNLINMIYSKQMLIKKAIEMEENIINDEYIRAVNEGKIATLDDFKTATQDVMCKWIDIDVPHSRIVFKFVKEDREPERIKAYTQLVTLINQYAKTLQYASAKVKDTDNEKFTFRTWLIRLGMIGDEYKVARKLLLQNLKGNSAFRYSKPEKVETIAGE